MCSPCVCENLQISWVFVLRTITNHFSLWLFPNLPSSLLIANFVNLSPTSNLPFIYANPILYLNKCPPLPHSSSCLHQFNLLFPLAEFFFFFFSIYCIHHITQLWPTECFRFFSFCSVSMKFFSQLGFKPLEGWDLSCASLGSPTGQPHTLFGVRTGKQMASTEITNLRSRSRT